MTYTLETRNGRETAHFTTLEALIPVAQTAAQARVPYRIWSSNADITDDGGWCHGLTEADRDRLEDAGLGEAG